MSEEEALLSMGYRRLNQNTYSKPIGFHLLTVELEPEYLISNWFKGANGSNMIWNTDTYSDEEEFLDWIKGFESTMRLDISIHTNSEFHFLTIQQKLEL